MRYVGICGSDIHYYATGRIGDQVVRYPFVLGHEGSGEIARGTGRFPAGLPVYIEPAMPCHRCDQCLLGRENTCRNLKFLGNPLESAGCMSEEIALPEDCIVPVPEWMTLEEAVLLEPLSIGVHATRRSGASNGCSAAIVGAGPIGLSVLLGLSQLDPHRVFVSEVVEARRQAAERLGASRSFNPGNEGAASSIFETAGGGVDVAFECAGSQESIDDATGMVKPGGTLVLIGIPEGTGRISYDPHLARRREVTVVNVRRQNKCVEQAMSILERRREAAKVMITHRFPPSRAKYAFDLVESKQDGAIKALLEF
jgi:L-iditol 2-dehydrogenase